MSYFKKSKAQLVMSDFLIGVVILIFIIVISAPIWGRTVENIRIKEERSEMENLVLSISDQMVKSPGMPSDWNRTNIKSIGLAEEDNVLDSMKVSNFTSLGADKTKYLLGIENYNFIFRLRNTNEIIFVEYGSLPITASEVVIIRRIVLYENLPTMMEFGVWI